MNDNDIGLIKETNDYDIWFEPLTDEINGFVIRKKRWFYYSDLYTQIS